MSVLSRDADRSMFGLVAGQHARISTAAASARGSSIFANLLLEGGGQGGHPAAVALKGAAENQLLGHGGYRVAEAAGWT